jgi:UDP-N-acetylmuramoyl-L-alanyl-D-glutamate--2,6-diaminopimelate ligase
MTALAMSLAPSPGVTLGELVRVLEPFGARLHGNSGLRVTGLRQDSRAITQGDLFCARQGSHSSGLSHLPEAKAKGALALLLQAPMPGLELGLPAIEVSDVRRAAAFAAEAIYGYPSRSLSLVGITGTNGKTTTSFLVEHALAELGQKPARLGTLGLSFGERQSEGSLTTPEADDLSRTLAEVSEGGGTHVVMEVSSHALDLARVAALGFRVGAFSNLSQDHLDFHASMAAYGAAKARLFHEFELESSVINVSDAFGAELARSARGRVIRVGREFQADFSPGAMVIDAHGSHGLVNTPQGDVALDSPLVGEHNLDNLLLALGILAALGFDAASAAAALGRAPQVPGRLERCDQPGDDVRVFVDYAHTPDALERVLAALRRVSGGELVCVFGCGGDRDAGKRPTMGAAVARGASRAYITSDNPRSEDPASIAAAIEPPLAKSKIPYVVELDRARAIERAISEAPAGATVLLAGKGHEPYQIIGASRRPFDDREQARRALALRRNQRGSP